MSNIKEPAPSLLAPSFMSDMTFSKPLQLELSHLGKTQSSSFSIKSETIRSPTQSSSSSSIQEEESKLKKTLIKIRAKSKALLLKYWFLLGLAIAILLSWRFPDVARKGGYLRAEWSIKWGNTHITS